MPSTKGKLVRFLGGLWLSHARVTAADEVSPGYRRLVLCGKFASPNPGDKLQILLPSDDVRTYTPISGADGEITLLGCTHAGGPGARWIAEVGVGADVAFARPQRSLVLPSGPVVMVGDETSVAVAASYERARPGQVSAIFCCSSPDALTAAAEAVGVRPLFVAMPDESSAVIDNVVAVKRRYPSATVALTGGSGLVVGARGQLRDRGISDVKVKTYWVPGRKGLD